MKVCLNLTCIRSVVSLLHLDYFYRFNPHIIKNITVYACTILKVRELMECIAFIYKYRFGLYILINLYKVTIFMIVHV